MKCVFCKETALLGTEPPCCQKCAEKLLSHFGIYCEGCDTLYWLPKTPENVDWFCKLANSTPQFVMENAVGLSVNRCKLCEKYLEKWGLRQESKWVQ